MVPKTGFSGNCVYSSLDKQSLVGPYQQGRSLNNNNRKNNTCFLICKLLRYMYCAFVMHLLCFNMCDKSRKIRTLASYSTCTEPPWISWKGKITIMVSITHTVHYEPHTFFNFQVKGAQSLGLNKVSAYVAYQDYWTLQGCRHSNDEQTAPSFCRFSVPLQAVENQTGTLCKKKWIEEALWNDTDTSSYSKHALLTLQGIADARTIHTHRMLISNTTRRVLPLC